MNLGFTKVEETLTEKELELIDIRHTQILIFEFE
jgi:hypothetical protein